MDITSICIQDPVQLTAIVEITSSSPLHTTSPTLTSNLSSTVSVRQSLTSSRNSASPRSCNHQRLGNSAHAEREHWTDEHVSLDKNNHDSRTSFYCYCLGGFCDEHARGGFVMIVWDRIFWRFHCEKRASTIIRKNAWERLFEHIIALRRDSWPWTKDDTRMGGSCRLYQKSCMKHVFTRGSLKSFTWDHATLFTTDGAQHQLCDGQW
jgi:hypothetical protein